MAVDMFIVIKEIKGESADAGFPGAIDVTSWTWGVSQTGSAQSGTGAGTGRAVVNDFVFTKYVDLASPVLVGASTVGTHYKSATFIARKAGATPLVYLKMNFYNVIIARVDHGGSSTDDRPTEQVHLNFGQFDFNYTPQTGTGGAGATVTAAYNMIANSNKLTT
jgi:type VI secretion system secreted protein Hcp